MILNGVLLVPGDWCTIHLAIHYPLGKCTYAYFSRRRDATIAALGVAAAATGAYLAIKWHRIRNEQIPSDDKWKKVGTMTDLVCYPIKSCGMIRKNTLHCSVLGLSDGMLKDRTFVVSNSERNFETARTHPKLILVQPEIDGEYLKLTAPGMDELKIHLTPLQCTGKITVWGQAVPAADCGEEAADWISRYLGKPEGGHRLTYYPNDVSHRFLALQNDLYPSLKQVDLGAFVDSTSYSLINEASVKDLNEKLEGQGDKPVDPLVFRGNFIIRPDEYEPYAEDNWNWVKIGEVVFRGVGPCTRCIMTSLDYENGTRRADRQPLKMLKKYRSIHETSPTMGRFLALRKGGDISVGDTVYVA